MAYLSAGLEEMVSGGWAFKRVTYSDVLYLTAKAQILL